MSIRFEEIRWLLALILPLLVLLLRPRRGGGRFGAYHLAARVLPRSGGPGLLRLIGASALVCLCIAMARPQYGRTISERERSGRDLMLVIDLSLSMSIDDMIGPADEARDRLAAVIEAAKRFVAGREGDRIGLVFFGSRALTSCPLTFDHASVEEFLDRTEQLQRQLWAMRGRPEGEQGLLGDGTNPGLGIGSALRWLREEGPDADTAAEAKAGRAIIVITDGRDSAELANWEDPVKAARYAFGKQVRVHCIGVGNPEGTATVQQAFGGVRRVRLRPGLLPDPARLQEIARAGQGTALMANDEAGLREVFIRIDELEPSHHQVRQRDDYTDRYLPWLLTGIILAAFGLLVEPRLRGPL